MDRIRRVEIRQTGGNVEATTVLHNWGGKSYSDRNAWKNTVEDIAEAVDITGEL